MAKKTAKSSKTATKKSPTVQVKNLTVKNASAVKGGRGPSERVPAGWDWEVYAVANDARCRTLLDRNAAAHVAVSIWRTTTQRPHRSAST